MNLQQLTALHEALRIYRRRAASCPDFAEFKALRAEFKRFDLDSDFLAFVIHRRFTLVQLVAAYYTQAVGK